MAQAEPAIPEKMQAAVFAEYGEVASVLSVQEFDVPEPSEGQVLIRVHAAAGNPLDYKIIQGHLASFLPCDLPKVCGVDVSGTVVKLGPGVDAYQVGDAVMGQTAFNAKYGSMAEYTCLDLDKMAAKPPNVSFVEAGGAGIVCGTSYQVLTNHSTIVAGESNVLILGGSSATGIMGIQFAKSLGAAMVATTSTQVDLCKSLGADVVVNYREADYSQELAEMKFDIVYDCVGQAGSFEKAQPLTRPGSTYVALVGPGPVEAVEYPEYKKIMQNQTQSWGEYPQILNDGGAKIILDARTPYTLDKVVEMFQDLMAHSARGKLVLQFVE